MLLAGEIRRRLRDKSTGLAITPILTTSQIKGAAVDLRLGPDLIVTRRETAVAAFNPARVEEMTEHIHDYQHYMRRPLGSVFYLHPGDFANARSLEYVTLPNNIAAEALGRSSWGRLGLVIATATLIQPNFQGTITLELANLGTVPLTLHVGSRIAQLTLFDTSDDSDEESIQ